MDGQDSGWVPRSDGQYCIEQGTVVALEGKTETKSSKNNTKKQEQMSLVLPYANHCKKTSVLLREFTNVLKTYVHPENSCSLICGCAIRKGEMNSKHTTIQQGNHVECVASCNETKNTCSHSCSKRRELLEPNVKTIVVIYPIVHFVIPNHPVALSTSKINISTSILKKVTYSLIISFGILFLCETALQFLWGPPPPAVQVHSRIEFLEKYLVPDRTVFVPIYQQTPVALLKPNTKQIAIFGGSSVHGGSIGVSSSNEFAGILNKRLPIQVNNFGAPSLDSHDILRISKELIEFSSAGWVLYTGHNDFGNAFFYNAIKVGEIPCKLIRDLFWKRVRSIAG